MRQILLFLILCSVGATVLSAQTSKRPATIILENGQKVAGNFQPLARGVTPQTVRLVLPDGQEKRFLTHEIKSFEYIRHDGKAERFERYAVNREMSPHLAFELDNTSAPICRHDTVLLQVVVQGK